MRLFDGLSRQGGKRGAGGVLRDAVAVITPAMAGGGMNDAPALKQCSKEYPRNIRSHL